jgi:hypothetical protein
VSQQQQAVFCSPTVRSNVQRSFTTGISDIFSRGIVSIKDCLENWPIMASSDHQWRFTRHVHSLKQAW